MQKHFMMLNIVEHMILTIMNISEKDSIVMQINS